ncbi:hypothetical protein AB1Y20_007101 [Prymnesium parvum]|uniref:Cilia- and flagella-associated protein 206 n=1 Tax=Prymnesium parvum TaxID=97485 RepID=A0AB34J3K7_PRYPA
MELSGAVREVVLQMLREARAARGARSEYAALLLDETTLRVASRGLKVSELMDEASGVTLVDSIDAPHENRAPEALRERMDAVYFVTPTRRSVAALLRDYADAPPLYGGAAHIFFSRHLPQELLELVKRSPVVGYVRTFREVNLEFLAEHPHAFSLDAPSALAQLFGAAGPAARAAAIDLYAEQLCTLCATLGESPPRVRCAAGAHPVVRQFCRRLAALLAALPPNARRPRGTIVIASRADDPLSPLLHDFSLEGLAQGAGLLREGRYRRGGTAAGEVLLHDALPVWRDLRYRSYELVPTLLQAHMERFVAENKAVVKAQRGEALTAAEKEEAVRKQFAFSFVKQREQLKVQEELVSDVTERLIREGKKTAWYEQLLLEQDLATGLTAEGAPLRRKDAAARLLRLLQALRTPPAAAPLAPADGGAPYDERWRLVALFTLCYPMSDDELEAELLRPAGMDLRDHLVAPPRRRRLAAQFERTPPQEAVRGLFYLGAQLRRERTAAAAKSAEDSQARRPPPPSAHAMCPAAFIAPPRSQVELARYTPPLKATIAAALDGTLSEQAYPEQGALPHAHATPAAAPAPYFYARFAQGAGMAETRRLRSRRLSCAQQFGREDSLIFGSTALLTPEQYVASLREPAPAQMLETSDWIFS